MHQHIPRQLRLGALFAGPCPFKLRAVQVDTGSSQRMSPEPSNPSANAARNRVAALMCVGAFALLSVVVHGFPLYDMVSGLLARGLDPSLLDHDYANYWVAGHLTRGGDQLILFNQSTYYAHLERLFGNGYPIHNWSYPPHFLPFGVPPGWLEDEGGVGRLLAG